VSCGARTIGLRPSLRRGRESAPTRHLGDRTHAFEKDAVPTHPYACDTTYDDAIRTMWSPERWRAACPTTASLVERRRSDADPCLRGLFDGFDTVHLPWVGPHWRTAATKIAFYLQEYPLPVAQPAGVDVLDGDRGDLAPPEDVMRQAYALCRDGKPRRAYRTVGATLRRVGDVGSRLGIAGDVLDHVVIADTVKLFAPVGRARGGSHHLPDMYTFAARVFEEELELLRVDHVVVLSKSLFAGHLRAALERWRSRAASRTFEVFPHPAARGSTKEPVVAQDPWDALRAWLRTHRTDGREANSRQGFEGHGTGRANLLSFHGSAPPELRFSVHPARAHVPAGWTSVPRDKGTKVGVHVHGDMLARLDELLSLLDVAWPAR
jgi:hypothetical protein